MQREPLALMIEDGHLSIRLGSGSPLATSRMPTACQMARPIVKWAGGKQWLAVAAQLLAPSRFGTYYEPFLGSGAFFFGLEPSRSVLSDKNAELITTYKAVRSDPEGVIRLLRRYPYNSDFYYNLRAKTPHSRRDLAARFLYLNHTCWNGLYRVNGKGIFNTPFGKYTRPMICDSARIRSAAKLFRRARLQVGDSEEIAGTVQPGDFVYFDPPYITGHQNNGFVMYNSKLFSWPDQKRLAELSISLAEKGVYVLVSNADHPSVTQLYRGFYQYQISRSSLIAANPASRGTITEALLSNYPILDVEAMIA